MKKDEILKYLNFPKRKRPSSKLLTMEEFERTCGVKIFDIGVKKTLLWLLELAKQAEVDTEDNEEILSFCRYLILTLSKTEEFLAYLVKNEYYMEDLEIFHEPEIVVFEGDK